MLKLNNLNHQVIYTVFFIVILSIFFGAFLYHKFSSFLRNLFLQRKFARGLKGEDDARKFLLKNGYEIIEEQPSREAVMQVDGEPVSYRVRADFLVEKDGRESIVEVKTGEVSTNPVSINTRRQLFEYASLYDVDDILFFDAEKKQLMHIHFDCLEDQQELKTGSFQLLYWGIIIGVIVTMVLTGITLWIIPIQ